MKFCNNPVLGVKLWQENTSRTSGIRAFDDGQDGNTLNQTPWWGQECSGDSQVQEFLFTIHNTSVQQARNHRPDLSIIFI